jgi:uncharacterized membrane protein YdcZ (DUF606 family)
VSALAVGRINGHLTKEVFVKASYLTTLFGSGTILFAVIQLIMFNIEEGGMPHDTSTWFSFAGKVIAGVGIILSKSFNVSNAPNPAAATVVSPASEAKPNPAAVPPPSVS